jgi:hypothetical protein
MPCLTEQVVMRDRGSLLCIEQEDIGTLRYIRPACLTKIRSLCAQGVRVMRTSRRGYLGAIGTTSAL